MRAPACGKCRSRNDRSKSISDGSHGIASRVPVRRCLKAPARSARGHVIAESHRVAPRPGGRRSAWRSPTAPAPPPSRVRRAGQQKTRHRTAPSPKGSDSAHPAEDPPAMPRHVLRGRGTRFCFFIAARSSFLVIKPSLSGIKFPAVSIVILQTMAIFASGNTKL